MIGLLSQPVYDYSDGSRSTRDARPPTPTDDRRRRGALIEGIIEETEDETLMDRYLGGEEIDLDVLVDDLETAVARGSFYPVVRSAPRPASASTSCSRS